MEENENLVEEFLRADNGENNIVMTSRRKRSENIEWKKICEFQCEEDALEYIESENTWKKSYINKTIRGGKITYRCKHGNYRKNECPKKIQLLYHSNNQIISLFSNTGEHIHSKKLNRGLNKNIKKTVKDLYASGIVKPNAILASLKKENLPEIPKTKLIPFLKKIRVLKYSSTSISSNDINEWCEERLMIPKSKNSAFILDYLIKYQTLNEKDPDLKIVLSTERLLDNLNNSDLVQVDSTHKIIWRGYSVLIIGTSDMNKVFHPFAVAMCKDEKEDDFKFIFEALKKYNPEWKPLILLDDGTEAITNGFIKTFGYPVMHLICFFHVLRYIETKLRSIVYYDEIKKDIYLLQNINNKNTFQSASRLFVEKWKNIDDSTINNFLNYFEKEWIETNPFWYEGAANGYPSSNNGIEDINAMIKKEHTFSEKLSIGQFLNKIYDILFKLSEDRDPNCPNFKSFALTPSICLKDWTEAYDWALLNKKIINVDHKYYVCSSYSNETNITTEILKKYQSHINDWKTFEELYFKIWEISVGSDLRKCTCTCPTYSQNYKCKHILGLQIRLHLTETPDEAKAIPLCHKRKRRRPCKVEQALISQ